MLILQMASIPERRYKLRQNLQILANQRVRPDELYLILDGYTKEQMLEIGIRFDDDTNDSIMYSDGTNAVSLDYGRINLEWHAEREFSTVARWRRMLFNNMPSDTVLLNIDDDLVFRHNIVELMDEYIPAVVNGDNVFCWRGKYMRDKSRLAGHAFLSPYAGIVLVGTKLFKGIVNQKEVYDHQGCDEAILHYGAWYNRVPFKHFRDVVADVKLSVGQNMGTGSVISRRILGDYHKERLENAWPNMMPFKDTHAKRAHGRNIVVCSEENLLNAFGERYNRKYNDYIVMKEYTKSEIMENDNVITLIQHPMLYPYNPTESLYHMIGSAYFHRRRINVRMEYFNNPYQIGIVNSFSGMAGHTRPMNIEPFIYKGENEPTFNYAIRENIINYLGYN